MSGTDLFPNFAVSPTILSARSGDWSSSSTWDLNRVPQAGDIVGIQTTHTVIYDVDSTAAIEAVGVAGTLRFRHDIDTKLTVQHLLVYGPDDSGWDAYGVLEIGTDIAPVSGATAQVVFSDVAINTGTQGSAVGRDPKEYGNGLLVWGTFMACGAPREPAFARLSAEADATDASVTLEEAVTGWQAGDLIIVPDSRQISGITGTPEGGDFTSHKEERTLSSVSGGGTTVNLGSALTYDHHGAYDNAGTLDYLPHVANVTRNVVLKSANPTGIRGHAIFNNMAMIDVCHVLMQDMGRTVIASLDSAVVTSGTLTHKATNQKGRYAWHCHHLIGMVGGLGYDADQDPDEFKPGDPANVYGCDGPSFRIVGCASYNTATALNFAASHNRWGITVHASSFGLIKGNVVYRVGGSGIATEDGSEWANVFEDNYVAEVSCHNDFQGGTNTSTGVNRADDRGYNDPPLDLGFEGAGLWFRGPFNYVRRNVMANCRIGCAFVFSPLYTAATKVPTFQGADPMVNHNLVAPQFEPIVQYEENEAYGGWTNQGLTIWDLGQQGAGVANLSQGESVLLNNVVWHVYSKGYYNYVVRHVTFDGWVVRGSFPNLVAGVALANGFYSGDYAAIDFKFIRCDIQGCLNGIDVNAVSIADDVSTMQIIDSHFCNYVDIQMTPGYSSGGASVVRPVSVEMHNCTHDVGSMPDGLYVTGTRAFIFRSNNSNGPDGANYVSQNDLTVYDFNGTPGDNFRAYFTHQAPSFVLPQNTLGGLGQVLVRGSAEAGLTNQQNHDKYEPWDYLHPVTDPPIKSDNPNPATPGLCFAATLAPGTTTRSHVIGYVEAF